LFSECLSQPLFVASGMTEFPGMSTQMFVETAMHVITAGRKRCVDPEMFDGQRRMLALEAMQRPVADASVPFQSIPSAAASSPCSARIARPSLAGVSDPTTAWAYDVLSSELLHTHAAFVSRWESGLFLALDLAREYVLHNAASFARRNVEADAAACAPILYLIASTITDPNSAPTDETRRHIRRRVADSVVAAAASAADIVAYERDLVVGIPRAMGLRSIPMSESLPLVAFELLQTIDFDLHRPTVYVFVAQYATGISPLWNIDASACAKIAYVSALMCMFDFELSSTKPAAVIAATAFFIATGHTPEKNLCSFSDTVPDRTIVEFLASRRVRDLARTIEANRSFGIRYAGVTQIVFKIAEKIL